MFAKVLLWNLALFSFLAWRCNGSRDADSATEVIDQLFENVAARLAGNKKCESVDPLPGCSITSDCLQITCNVNFVEKQAALRATINRCDEPITVTINTQVKDEGIDWTYVFTSSSKIAIPGLAVDGLGGAKAGFFLNTEITPDEDGMLALKITLELGTTAGSFLSKKQLVDQKLQVSTEYCDFVRWWLDRNTAERVVLMIAACLLILSITTGCCFCCCCCCCRPCKKKRAARVV